MVSVIGVFSPVSVVTLPPPGRSELTVNYRINEYFMLSVVLGILLQACYHSAILQCVLIILFGLSILL